MTSKNMVRLGGAYVEITADNGKLVNALKDSESRIQSFASEFAKVGAAFSAVGAGVAIPLKKAVDSFAEFEKQMLITQSVTKATDSQLARLTKQAKQLGATTSWTAAQVAEGMVSLGRMGFDNTQIKDTISSVMDLGRALDVDVNQAAKELGAVMRQFGADSSKAGHYADALATATNAAAIEMDELLESMKYVGAAGNALGADVETVLALTMALRNSGISASQAGTQLRAMFLKLQSPKDIELFGEKFNTEVYDANGRLRSFIDILVDAQKQADALGDKLPVVARQMFGTLQAPGFITLLKNKDLEKFRDMLYKCDGAAEKFRGTMESGVFGSLKRSESMIEAVGLELGQSLAPTVRDVEDTVKDITDVVRGFIQDNKPLLNMIAKTSVEFAAMGGAMLVGGGILKGLSGTSQLVTGGFTKLKLAWQAAGEEVKRLAEEAASLKTMNSGDAIAESLNNVTTAAMEATVAVEGLAKAEAELGKTYNAGPKPFFKHTDVEGMTVSQAQYYVNGGKSGSYSVNQQPPITDNPLEAGYATTNSGESSKDFNRRQEQQAEAKFNREKQAEEARVDKTKERVENDRKKVEADADREVQNAQVNANADAYRTKKSADKTAEDLKANAQSNRDAVVDDVNAEIKKNKNELASKTKRLKNVRQKIEARRQKRVNAALAEEEAALAEIERNKQNADLYTEKVRNDDIKRAVNKYHRDVAKGVKPSEAKKTLDQSIDAANKRFAESEQRRAEFEKKKNDVHETTKKKIDEANASAKNLNKTLDAYEQKQTETINQRIDEQVKRQKEADAELKKTNKEIDKAKSDAQKSADKQRKIDVDAAKESAADKKYAFNQGANQDIVISQARAEENISNAQYRMDAFKNDLSVGQTSASVKGGKAEGAYFASNDSAFSFSAGGSYGPTISGNAPPTPPNSGSNFSTRSWTSMDASEMTDEIAKLSARSAKYRKRYSDTMALINQHGGGATAKEAAYLKTLSEAIAKTDMNLQSLTDSTIRFSNAAPTIDVSAGFSTAATSADDLAKAQEKIIQQNAQNASAFSVSGKAIDNAAKSQYQFSSATKEATVNGQSFTVETNNCATATKELVSASANVDKIGMKSKIAAKGAQALKFAVNGVGTALKGLASMAVGMLAWEAVAAIFEQIAKWAHKTAEDMERARESNSDIMSKDQEAADEATSNAASDEQKIDKLVSIAGSGKNLNATEKKQLDELYDDLYKRGITGTYVVKDDSSPTGYKVGNAGAANAMKARAIDTQITNLEKGRNSNRVDVSALDPTRYAQGTEMTPEQVANALESYKAYNDLLKGFSREQRKAIFGENTKLGNRLNPFSEGGSLFQKVLHAQNVWSSGQDEEKITEIKNGIISDVAQKGELTKEQENTLRQFLDQIMSFNGADEMRAKDKSRLGAFYMGGRGFSFLQSLSEDAGENFLETFKALSEFGATDRTLDDLKKSREAYLEDARAEADKPYESEEAQARQASKDAETAQDVANAQSAIAEAFQKREDQKKTPAQRALDTLTENWKTYTEGLGFKRDEEGVEWFKEGVDQEAKDKYLEDEKKYLEEKLALEKQINEELEKQNEEEKKKLAEEATEKAGGDLNDMMKSVFAGDWGKANELGKQLDAYIKERRDSGVDMTEFYKESVGVIKDALEKTKTTLASVGTFNALEFADFGRDVELDIQKEQLNMLRSANTGLQNIYAWMQTDDKYKEYM